MTASRTRLDAALTAYAQAEAAGWTGAHLDAFAAEVAAAKAEHDDIAAVSARLAARLGRLPTAAELAAEVSPPAEPARVRPVGGYRGPARRRPGRRSCYTY
jgi:hypothetical protein